MTDARAVLAIKLDENDADAATIGDYVKKLLLTLWREGESFSGKHPFGNSGWEYDLYPAMYGAGLIGEDQWGDADSAAGRVLIEAAIEEVFK